MSDAVLKHPKPDVAVEPRYVAPFKLVRYDIAKRVVKGNEALAGYNYRIKHSDDRVGDAQLFIFNVERKKPLSDLFNRLLESGLQPDDRLAHLNEFYPNGRGTDDEISKYMRAGVGSAVLDVMTKDSLDWDAKVMFVFTGEPSMQSFVHKKGFEPVDKIMYEWYKLL